MSPDVTNYSGLHIRLSFSSYLPVWQVSAHFILFFVCEFFFLNSTIYENNNNNKKYLI